MFALQYVLLVSFLVPPPAPLHVGPTTTYLTAPRNADGTVNYVAAINTEASKDLKPEDNAAVGLAKALGPTALNDLYWAEALGILELAAMPQKGDYFLNFPAFEAREGRREERPTKPDGTTVTDPVSEIAETRAWSATEFPVIADWLKANDKPLDLMAKAATCKRFYWPLVSPSFPPRMSDQKMPPYGPWKGVANTLLARIMLRIGSGDTKGAAADALTLIRLGRLFSQDPPLIGQLVSYAFEAMGDSAVFHLIDSGKLTSKEARQLLADIDALPARRALATAFRGERLQGLDIVAAIYRQDPGVLADWGFTLPAGVAAVQNSGAMYVVMDPNIILHQVNSWCDKLDQAAAKPTYTARTEAIAAFERDLRALTGDARAASTSPAMWATVILLPAEQRRAVTSVVIGNQMVGLLLPALGAIHHKVHAKIEMRTDLVRVALALTAYRADKGKYPDKRGDLSPQYLAKIPVDIFNDQALGYEKDGESCVVYSVGPDLKEGGDEKSKLVVRLAPPGK
jgi:hypothetical protein